MSVTLIFLGIQPDKPVKYTLNSALLTGPKYGWNSITRSGFLPLDALPTYPYVVYNCRMTSAARRYRPCGGKCDSGILLSGKEGVLVNGVRIKPEY